MFLVFIGVPLVLLVRNHFNLQRVAKDMHRIYRLSFPGGYDRMS